MDAWANISHFLEYKSENDIPLELKRDFNALSGLFYVADTHFEMFYKERQENTSNISIDIDSIVHKKGNTHDTALNFDSLALYLLNKFPDRKHYQDSKDVSDLLESLINHGYTTIQILDEKIENALLAFNAYEKNRYSYAFFSDIGVVRTALSMVDNSYNQFLLNDIDTVDIVGIDDDDEDEYAQFRHLIKND